MEKWQKKAIAEGRICPECKQPVSLKTWDMINKTNPIGHCWSCKYAHWEVPLGCRGNSFFDNQGREGFVYLRGSK